MLATVFIIVGVISISFILYLTFRASKVEKEYKKKLEKSLEDEYIIDPETGAKLTLEEAESGHWISHDNEFYTIPDSEIETLVFEEEQQVEIALNYLRGNHEYKRLELTDEQWETLNNTKMLTNYDDWSYSNPFSFNNGVVFLPAPKLHGKTYYQDDYVESQLMFWIKVTNTNGHYFFREKSSAEKILDLIRNDDDIKLDNYECFTIRKSRKIIPISNILEKFENVSGLEIEINNKDLFIKTLKLINLKDIKRIEEIIKKIT